MSSFDFVEKVMTIGGAGTPPLLFYKKGFNIGGSVEPTWQDIILSGNTALTLVNAKADSLEYLKLFGGTEQRNLPSGYTELQSVSGVTSGACFDTGIAGNNNNLRFKFIASKSEFVAYTPMIGNYYDENSNTTRIIAGGSATAGVIAEINRRAGNSTVTNTVDITAEHEYELYKESGISVLKVDGVIIEQMTDSSGTDNSRTVAINSSNVRTTASTSTIITTFKGHFYIWDGATLIREYVPAKRNSDNKVGFYDLVNGTFNPSMFDDYQFTAGADVVPTPEYPMDIVCNNGVLKAWEGETLSLNSGTPLRCYLNSPTTQVSHYTWRYFEDSSFTLRLPVIGNNTYRLYWDDTNSDVVGTLFRVTAVITDDVPTQQGARIDCYKANGTEYGAIVGREEGEGTPQTNTNVVFTCGSDVKYIYIQIAGDINYWDSDVTTLINSRLSHLHFEKAVLHTEGIVETVEIDTTGDTATAEMLLAVDNYKDEQEVLSGSVTRKVGIKVLDGSENWQKGQTFYVDNLFNYAKVADNIPFCTHYKGIRGDATATDYLNTNSVRLYTTTASRLNIFAVMGDYADTNAFKQFLASQYANGTPVIIVYPLATPTTETVTAQPLSIQSGTNIITAEGSIDNLPLEVSYKAGVAVTITEVQNAQLDNNVEVTING